MEFWNVYSGLMEFWEVFFAVLIGLWPLFLLFGIAYIINYKILD